MSSDIIPSFVPAVVTDCSPIFYSWIIAVFLNYYVRNYKKSLKNPRDLSLALLLFIINMTSLIGPAYFPYKTLSFIIGGTVFSSWMIVNNNIYTYLLNNNTNTKMKDDSNKESNNNNISLYTSLKEVLFYQRIPTTNTTNKQNPTSTTTDKTANKYVFKWKRLIYLIYVWLVADALVYLMKEWIPLYILPEYHDAITPMIKGIHT